MLALPITLVCLPLTSFGVQDAAQEVVLEKDQASVSEGLFRAVGSACLWLVVHQDKDGRWDSDGFMKHDGARALGAGPLTDDEFWERALAEKSAMGAEELAAAGPGDAQHDIGVTGLALLALMADGHSSTQGLYHDAVGRGLEWLVANQDVTTGLFGVVHGTGFHYDHAIATLALAESIQLDGGDVHRLALQAAVNYIESARNPYGAWRYSSPPDGDNDSSVTAWMVAALASAEEAGAKVDPGAFQGAKQWFEEMTDEATARVGYTERGSRSSRVPGMNDIVPSEGAETITAGAVSALLRMGLKPQRHAVLVEQVKLMLRALDSTPRDEIRDAVWLFWGTAAMEDVGSLPWTQWSQVVRPLLMETQSQAGATAGSWDPTGAWGYSLGRVGTTALGAHALATMAAVQLRDHPTLVRDRFVDALLPAEDAVEEEHEELRPISDAELAASVTSGLEWLAQNQNANGGWSAGEQAGPSNNDIGVTGLALLALMGDGHTIQKGKYQGVVQRGVKFLTQQQDRDTGLIGEQVGYTFLYNHAVATLALTEMCVLTDSILLKERAQQAVHYIARARNPYGVWRYDVPPTGDADTSMTSWMVQVLRSAMDAGLKIDFESFQAAEAWIDEVTDPATGRTGYTERGSVSARVPGKNDHFAVGGNEPMTAAGLYSLFLIGRTPDQKPIMNRQADLVLGTVDLLEGSDAPHDLYSMYFGTRAMYQMGGTHWKRWSQMLRRVAVETQVTAGVTQGSWDPNGPWGYAGGRVYSTSMMVMSALMVKAHSELMK